MESVGRSTTAASCTAGESSVGGGREAEWGAVVVVVVGAAVLGPGADAVVLVGAFLLVGAADVDYLLVGGALLSQGDLLVGVFVEVVFVVFVCVDGFGGVVVGFDGNLVISGNVFEVGGFFVGLLG